MCFCYVLCFGHGSPVCKNDSSGGQWALLGTTAVPERYAVIYPKTLLKAKEASVPSAFVLEASSVLGFVLSYGAGILRGVIGKVSGKGQRGHDYSRRAPEGSYLRG